MEEAASDSVRQCPAIQIRIARNASSDGSQPADPDPWCEKTRRTLNGPILVTDRLRGLCPDRRAGEHDRSHYQQKRADHHECIKPPQRKSKDPHRSLLSPNTPRRTRLLGGGPTKTDAPRKGTWRSKVGARCRNSRYRFLIESLTGQGAAENGPHTQG